jgi:hypothetical protein
MAADMNEAHHKFRPHLNIVKFTLRAFIRVVYEVALEEASVAAHSSYGREVILFNPMKNCGKFHFCFYLLCCATSFGCVRMKVATKNSNDNPEPYQSMGTIYNTATISKLNKRLMEMWLLIFALSPRLPTYPYPVWAPHPRDYTGVPMQMVVPTQRPPYSITGQSYTYNTAISKNRDTETPHYRVTHQCDVRQSIKEDCNITL